MPPFHKLVDSVNISILNTSSIGTCSIGKRLTFTASSLATIGLSIFKGPYDSHVTYV